MNCYKNNEAENAMAVVASWVSKNPKIKVTYHDGKAVDADIHTGKIRIPRLACASGITEEALMILRGHVYHEAKHIDSTKLEKKDFPKGALFQILNGLEDRRIEAEGSVEHLGCKMVFAWMNNHYNKKIAGQIVSGEVAAPLWEALCAMGFQVEGISPAWKLTDKAQAYFDAAYDEFSKVRQTKNTSDCVALAKKIYDIIKETSEEFNKEKKPEQKKEEKKEEKQEKQGKGEKEESDKGEEGDDGEGSGSAGDVDDESEEESEGSEGEGSDKSDEESEEESESSSKGSEGDKSDEESEGDKCETEGSSDLFDESDVEYKQDNSGKQNIIKTGIEEEISGPSMTEIMNERLSEIFDEMPASGKDYLAFRDNDVHIVPETVAADKIEFMNRRRMIGAAVANMTHALAQALRSMAKTRKAPYLRQGKIDKKRLVQITKSLSKEVFFKTEKGQELDVAVEIVVDESGSMRNFFEVQLMLIAIGESLSQIGVPFEVIGMTTTDDMPRDIDRSFTRYNPILYKHYKNFSEQWINVRQRIVKTSRIANNVDGEVVEYAAFRLGQRKESRKVIFSLSDGRPCAGQGNDGEMCENLKNVCDRVRKAGIQIVSFGIGTQEPMKYYGEKNFVFLRDIASMGREFIKKFVDVIAEGKVKV